jgi:nitrite reductase (NO-forming)
VAAPGAGAHADMHAPTVFTLRSGIADGRMVFLGVGREINGQVNPTLNVHEGEVVQINLINGEGAEHDIVVDQYAVRSDRVVGKGASSIMSFTADRTGEFIYFCSVPGHREAGTHPSRARTARGGRRHRSRHRAGSDRPAGPAPFTPAASGANRSRYG